MITILYFAAIREKLGISQETVELPPEIDRAYSLAAWLRQRGSHWQEALVESPHLKVAINQSLSSLNATIKDGDEIAFFPPVTGG